MPTTTRTFIDTNIQVYAHDGRDPAKRDRSQELIGSLAASGTGVISTQVMQEFFSIATRRLGLAP